MRWWSGVAFGALAAVAAGLWLTGKKPEEDKRILRIAISPSGRWLAAGSASGKVSVIAVGSGALVSQVRTGDVTWNDLQFAPDEEVLGIAGRNLWLWRFRTREAPRQVRGDGLNYGMAEFDSAGATLLTVTGSGRMERIDLVSGGAKWSTCCTSIYGDVRFAPGGRIAVNAGHRPGLWDADTGALLERLEPERSSPAYGPIAFDAARGHVCLGSQDGSLLCRDLATRKPVEAPGRQAGWIESIVFLGDGSRAALLARDVGLLIWERASGAVRKIGGTPGSNLAAFPGGSRLAFGTAAGQIEWRDAASGELVRAFDSR